MKKATKILLLSSLLMGGIGGGNALRAQSEDPVVIEVAGEQIRKSEFMKEFMNSVGRQLDAKEKSTPAQRREALEEYVELYAIFRAKLADAHALGFDTAQALLTELAQYRQELAAPYLIDSTMLENLMREAYERNHYSLHAAHILVQFPPDAAPEDTLSCYNRIMELRQRVMNGEDFFAVAGEVVRRNNAEAPVRQNEGDLGYFTAFDMVYPFENAAYALQVGEVSMPVRTRYGYHIIKLLDKVRLVGKNDIAHIWLSSRDSNQRRSEIENIYNQLLSGDVGFEQMATRSDDRTTSRSGGLLRDALVNMLPVEYIHVAQDMKDGEISKPFFTQYGWHIIKMVRRDTLPPIESMEPYYKQRMTRDQRGAASKKAFVQHCIKKYGIQDLTQTPVAQPKGRKKKGQVKMQASLQELYDVVPVEATRAAWNYSDTMIHNEQPIFVLPNKVYTTLDLARYISTHQDADRPLKPNYFVDMQYEEFKDSVVMVYADSRLEEEYPEFAAIVDEYRRGLMIFNYNNEMVWTKALKDTAGFTEFYNRDSKTRKMSVPEDSVYFWKTRARVVEVTVADSGCLAPAKAEKMLRKALKKNMGSSEMKAQLGTKVSKNCTAAEPVSVKTDLVEKDYQTVLGTNQWEKGVYLSPKKRGYMAVVVEEVLEPCLKSQTEARGYYLNGFQNEVEQKHNAELKKKYDVRINRDVVSKIEL